jgi:glycosyltransferase involved in cell wall biosynthesis
VGDPQVTVVIPVYNAADYLDECLRSIVGQTIGFEQLEVVAVDDGSTDGSSDRLDGWAASHPNIRVIHQPNSGAPGAPRNRAVALARGEYVFFADADDYLGVEALERMLAVASRNESDIVLGRIRGVNRTAATRPFRNSVERGDVVSTDAVWSLTAHKLIRRSLIVDNGLRFAEGVRLAEELPLIVPAYFLARAISVVADYDCYHLMLREHAAHLTRQPADPATFFPVVRFAVETVVANTAPGPARDGMLRRWAQVEIAGKFGKWFAGLPAEVREEYVKRSAEILDDLIPP